jgi:hypothetical protein
MKLKSALIIAIGFSLFACSPEEKNSEQNTGKNLLTEDKISSIFPDTMNVDSLENTDFALTLESEFKTSKNTIYAATVLMAWDEIRNELNGVISKSDNPYFNFMNESVSYLDVLKSDEYQSSVEINGPLLTARAYFSISLPFQEPLNDYGRKYQFKRDSVSSFGFYGDETGVRINYYNSDDDFSISFVPKDMDHEIILIKKHFKSKTTFAREFEKYEKAKDKFLKGIRSDKIPIWKAGFEHVDQTMVPKMAFNLTKVYKKLMGAQFEVEGYDDNPHQIYYAYQRNAFILNEKGAEVESYSVVEEATSEEAPEIEKPQPKKLFFNDNFIIFLKRRDAKWPYFAVFVKDTELMEE